MPVSRVLPGFIKRTKSYSTAAVSGVTDDGDWSPRPRGVLRGSATLKYTLGIAGQNETPSAILSESEYSILQSCPTPPATRPALLSRQRGLRTRMSFGNGTVASPAVQCACA